MIILHVRSNTLRVTGLNLRGNIIPTDKASNLVNVGKDMIIKYVVSQAKVTRSKNDNITNKK